MTSKTELKELIISLRDEIRELKTEITAMRSLIVNSNTNTIYPIVGTLDHEKNNKITWSPVEITTTFDDAIINTTKATSSNFNSYPKGTTESDV